jgi:hypothetical protein
MQISQLMKATEISGAKWHSRLTAGVKNAHSFIHATKTGFFKTMATEMLTYCYKHSVRIPNISLKKCRSHFTEKKLSLYYRDLSPFG